MFNIRILLLLFSFFAISCKTTLPEPKAGLKRGPISTAIWGNPHRGSEFYEHISDNKNLEYRDVSDIHSMLTELHKNVLFSESYMKKFHNRKWIKYRNDEILFSEKLNEISDIINKKWEEYTLDGWKFGTHIDFGKYDLLNNSFPLEDIKDIAKFKFNFISPHTNSRDSYDSDVISNSYFVLISNYGSIPKSISVPLDKAKEILASKKNTIGNIDRRFYLIVEVDFSRVANESEMNSFKGFPGLVAKVKSAEIYIDSNNYELLGKVKIK